MASIEASFQPETSIKSCHLTTNRLNWIEKLANNRIGIRSMVAATFHNQKVNNLTWKLVVTRLAINVHADCRVKRTYTIYRMHLSLCWVSIFFPFVFRSQHYGQHSWSDQFEYSTKRFVIAKRHSNRLYTLIR